MARFFATIYRVIQTTGVMPKDGGSWTPQELEARWAELTS